MVKKIGYVMVVTLLMIWSMAAPAEASQNWMQVYTHIEPVSYTHLTLPTTERV